MEDTIGRTDPPCGERFQPREHSVGPLHIWELPVPGKQYVLSSDVAGGGPLSDYCTAMVIEADTCDLVAGAYERLAPIPWGRKLARLGWMYNEALLGIEVFPSAHGMSASDAAETYGYVNMYQRRNRDRYGRPATQSKGFRTDASTKPMMIDRTREALDRRYVIPWRRLLLELKKQRWDANKPGILSSKVADDLFDAYAIGLMVRDDAWTRGQLKRSTPKPTTDTERYWENWHRQQELKNRAARRGHHGRSYAGI